MPTELTSIVTPARSTDGPRLAQLAIFWFGIQALWGAMLGISLQARVVQLSESHALVFYGYVATIGAIAAACTQLVAGPISDALRRRGSKRIEFYIVGAASAAVALPFFYGARSTVALLVAYAALQVGINVAIGPYQAVIPESVASTTAGRASAWMAGFQSAGNASGAVLATLCGNGFVLAGALGALLITTCALTSRAIASTSPERMPRDLAVHVPVRAFALLFASRVALFAGFYTLLGYMFFYTEAFITPDVSRARQIDGLLVLLFTILGACGAAVAAKPADRYDRRAVACTGAAAAMAALVIFVLGRSPVAVAFALPLGGIGWGTFLVADWAIACRVISRRSAAGAMAVWNLAVLIPQVLAPVAATSVIVSTGVSGKLAVTYAFGLAGLEMLVGIWLLQRLPVEVARE